MPRYIDAEKLKKHYAWWGDETKETFDAIIDQQPTADVVEVVQCKDCKHLNHMGIGGYRKCLRDNLWKDADDFCSRGERRK